MYQLLLLALATGLSREALKKTRASAEKKRKLSFFVVKLVYDERITTRK
jgi:hypothetical protein